MILSKFGVVKMSSIDEEKINELGIDLEDAELACKGTIYADLSSILDALEQQYDTITAMELWEQVAHDFVEERTKKK